MFRVDGERGFSIEVVRHLQQLGVDNVEIAPPYTHTANARAENTIKQVIESLRLVLGEKKAPLSDWSLHLATAVRRLNHRPDKTDGKSAMQRMTGVPPLRSLISRLKAHLSAHPNGRDFKPGEEVLWAPANRKERPGFNKLERRWERAEIIAAPAPLIRIIMTESGSQHRVL